MILYTNVDTKIHCTKTKMPKVYLVCGWDHITTKINGEMVRFWNTVKNNSTYYYFEYQKQWYKTKIVSDDGFDVFCYIYNHIDGTFHTK